MPNIPQITPTSQYPGDALSSSVQIQPEPVTGGPGAYVFTWNIASAADMISPWGRAVQTRDRQLRDFWPTEPYLAGAMANVAFRNSVFNWEIRGPERVAQAVTDMLGAAIAGDSFGWVQFMQKYSQDLYTTDNGAFIELIRDEPVDATSRFKGPLAPVIGIAHLDSNQCQRTGNATYPVIYTDRQGARHKLAWYQVIPFADYPSAIEKMNGVGYCLHRDSRVLLADGTYARIIDLVEKKYSGEVYSLDTQGRLVKRRVTNWYKNPRNGRKMVNLRAQSASINRGNHPKNSWVTEDHPVLTMTGWKKAGELVVGDKIATGYRAPNRKQTSLLIGTLLGDACIQAGNLRKRMSMAHKKRQGGEWLQIKAKALSCFQWNISEYQQMIRAESGYEPALVNWRTLFYSNGKKQMPLDTIDEYFDPILMAAWYMDDGWIENREPNPGNRQPRASIGTSGSSKRDVQRIVLYLSTRGFECSPVSSRGEKGKYNILFSVEGSRKLFDYIGAYVVPCYRYKLPENAPAYDPAGWDLGESVPFYDWVNVEKEKRIGQTDKRPGYEPEYVYCLDVEDTHNFITAGMVVHNCAVTRILKMAQIARSIALFKDEKISGRQYKQIHFVSGVSRQDIKDEMQRGQEEANNSGMIRFIMPAILASLDPEKPVSTATIDLANLPDGFDYDQEMKWYISCLALGFGVDYQEFAPLPGGNIGSSQQSMILHRKGSGKGPAVLMRSLSDAFKNYGVLPRNCQMRWNDKDEQEELEKQQVRTKAMEEMAIAINSHAMTPKAAAQSMVRRGIWEEEDIREIPDDFWLMFEREPQPVGQPVGNRGGNTIVEDAGRQNTGKTSQTAGDRLRKFFGGTP